MTYSIHKVLDKTATTYYPDFHVFGLQEGAQEPQEHPKFMHEEPAEHLLDVSRSQDKSDPENIWTE